MPILFERNGRLQGAKLEYNVVDHCNLACRHCSHFSPHLPRNSAALDAFVGDLTRLAEVYKAGRFRFVGGEPLLHRDLLEFVHAVRRSGIADEIEVVTNGVLLDRAEDALFAAIDRLSVSWYPGTSCREEILLRAAARCSRFDVRMSVERIERFRRMQVREPIADAALVRRIYRTCLIAHVWSCQTFYDGNFYLCSRPIYTDAYLAKVGRPPADLRRADGIALHEPNLLERLRSRLASDKPLDSCRYCLGTVGVYEPHAQMSKAERRSPSLGPSATSGDIDMTRLKALELSRGAQSALLRALPSSRFARALAKIETAVIGD